MNLHNDLSVSSGAHLKVFGVEHFDAAHSTDTLLVGALLAVGGAGLVHAAPAQSTPTVAASRVGVDLAVRTAHREQFVLVHFAPALDSVPRARFPCIWIR
jgi:hypothetical protein